MQYLLHWNLEGDVGTVLADVPETAQIFSVNGGEIVVGCATLSIVTQDVHQARHFVRD